MREESAEVGTGVCRCSSRNRSTKPGGSVPVWRGGWRKLLLALIFLIAASVEAVPLVMQSNGRRGLAVVAFLLLLAIVSLLALTVTEVRAWRQGLRNPSEVATRLLLGALLVAVFLMPAAVIGENTAHGWNRLVYKGRLYDHVEIVRPETRDDWTYSQPLSDLIAGSLPIWPDSRDAVTSVAFRLPEGWLLRYELIGGP
jgi:hypothetical protein